MDVIVFIFQRMAVDIGKCSEKELQPGGASCLVDLFGQMVVTRSFG
jgi:hypothetical protein